MLVIDKADEGMFIWDMNWRLDVKLKKWRLKRGEQKQMSAVGVPNLSLQV